MNLLTTYTSPQGMVASFLVGTLFWKYFASSIFARFGFLGVSEEVLSSWTTALGVGVAFSALVYYSATKGQPKRIEGWNE
jgi:membrane-bound metal-dependent hydrolase YbcI (DUF457 family)